MTWLIVPPDSGIETASSEAIWKGKLMVPLHFSFPLFGKYLGRRAVIFPLSCAVSVSTAPPGLKRVQVPDVSSWLFFFYITSFLDPHDCSYWISVVARGCAAVTVFLAVLCALVACVVELGIARGSAHADISGSRHEKTILRLWRSWERQRQRITAGPGRMRAVVLGRSCLFGYGSVWLRGKWERGDARFLLVPFSQLPFFLYLSIHSCSEQALALKLTSVAFTWQFLKAALNLSNYVVRSSSHPKYGLWGVGGGFPRQLLCFWCKMKALSLFARNFGAALTISDLKKARSLWQHHKWVLKQNTKYGTRSASLFCLHVLGGRLCRQSLIFWRAESSIPHWKKWVIWDTC